MPLDNPVYYGDASKALDNLLGISAKTLLVLPVFADVKGNDGTAKHLQKRSQKVRRVVGAIRLVNRNKASIEQGQEHFTHLNQQYANKLIMLATTGLSRGLRFHEVESMWSASIRDTCEKIEESMTLHFNTHMLTNLHTMMEIQTDPLELHRDIMESIMELASCDTCELFISDPLILGKEAG